MTLAALLLIVSGAGAAGEPQATSLLGRALVPAPPSAETLANLAAARANFERDPADLENIIWYGRRTAYAGDYRGAIAIYSEGIERYPDEPRLYRHRGHRYISVREFDNAIADLERAAALTEGTENRIEADGLPNALNIPISTLHGNIFYHLGLAYYLKHDWPNALRAYDAAFAAGDNDDNRVSTTHWRYMILRRMGRDNAAEGALQPIHGDMNIIENHSYYRLCRLYQGALPVDELLAEYEDSPGGSAVGYGIANWYFVNGEVERALAMWQELADSAGWAAFGVIAAEADLAAYRSREDAGDAARRRTAPATAVSARR